MDLGNKSTKRNSGVSRFFLEECILKIAQSNKSTLALLYEETKNGVYSFVLSYLKNPSDAEDILQETYIKIWFAAGTYQPKGNPMAWILTIAKNLSLMRLRKKKTDINCSEEEWMNFYPDSSFASSDDKMILEAAFSCLSDEERNIITLHAVSGLKHREIADLLALPLSTVLSKYHRAKKKMRTIIREGGID